MEKFENKIIDMRDMYEERKNHGIPMRVEEANADLDLDLDTESWVCFVAWLYSFPLHTDGTGYFKIENLCHSY